MAFPSLPPTIVPTKWDSVKNYAKQLVGFVGPGYVIAVGYMDPGNWATDLAGGSQYGYTLLFVIFLSNLIAILLQSLAIKLGVVTRLDLAQACRAYLPRWLNYILYVLCEAAIVACDLAEVIGSAIALKLLFGLPLPWGVAITGLDVLVILFAYRDERGASMRVVRLFEFFVMALVGSVFMCFVVELTYSNANPVEVLKGYLPSGTLFQNQGLLYVAVGIIGATVMPHNLYLHSSLVQSRSDVLRTKMGMEQGSNDDDAAETTHGRSSPPPAPSLTTNPSTPADVHEFPPPLFDPTTALQRTIRTTLHFSIMDSTLALSLALFVNSAILIVSAANFFYSPPDSPQHQETGDLVSAHHLLATYLGPPAGLIFALALLFAGQSSTLTATMAGQIVMSGFLGITVRPWLRRLITRLVAIIPAMVVAFVKGDNGLNGLLVASQVALSLQLPFAVIPLVWFTSSKTIMRAAIDPAAIEDGVEGRGWVVELVPSKVKKSDEMPDHLTGTTVPLEVDMHEDADVSLQRLPDASVSSSTLADDPPVSSLVPTNPSHRRLSVASHRRNPSIQANASANTAAAPSYSRPEHHPLDFSNPIWLAALGGLASLLIVSLNFVLLVQTFSGNGDD
ncbi:natural resistance-associated macrophage protein-domain-containing protein [Jimgerdemannia flammicorona]|uniref:Natural resistance-associated macrophage protein-domain-containing protein n=1 Tax=Jimgerdemannia flammicorona TaxID=994334 RepID=A0A433D344_9FUNG|nr:natural resistance-associated macrophage protein-domain-containing protein [Jimgerdemannia flammicorona]